VVWVLVAPSSGPFPPPAAEATENEHTSHRDYGPVHEPHIASPSIRKDLLPAGDVGKGVRVPHEAQPWSSGPGLDHAVLSTGLT
jgi:hypothetical protein